MGQSDLPRHSCPCFARYFTSSRCNAFGSGAGATAQALAVSALNKAIVVIFRIMVNSKVVEFLRHPVNARVPELRMDDVECAHGPSSPREWHLSRVRSRLIAIELREAAVVPWTHGQYESGPVARLCRGTIALNDLRTLA